MAEPDSVLRRLDADVDRPELICDDADIDEFYSADSIVHGKELLCVTYALMEGDDAVAFFSVSNDAIIKGEVPGSARRRLLRKVPRPKQYSSMPAAKIGRLGVARDLQRAGYGTKVLDIIKASFTTRNKTGCRFLLVDAYNQKRVTDFYRKNGFDFLWANDVRDKTRIMWFDLMTFVR